MMPRAIEVKKIPGLGIPSRRYATHAIDRYPAKMVPHLARHAIQQVSKEGDLVLDPFCGCGTVQVECLLTGRDSLGLDVNPVAVVLARAKSAVYNIGAFLRLVKNVEEEARRKRNMAADYPSWLTYWFTRRTLEKLISIRYAIVSRRGTLSGNLYHPLLAALIIAVRKCSRADPRSPKPFISKRARETRVRKHFDAFKVFQSVAEGIAQASSDLQARLVSGSSRARSHLADSRRISSKRVASVVDAVVTSPPYLSAQDYYRSSKLELAIAGLWNQGMESSLGASLIGSGRGRLPDQSLVADEFQKSRELIKLRRINSRSAVVVNSYLGDIREVLRRIHPLIKKHGLCCLVVGDSTISGIKLPVHRWFIRIAKDIGFKLVKHEVDTIRDRHVPPQREQHNSVIESEHLLFFRK